MADWSGHVARSAAAPAAHPPAGRPTAPAAALLPIAVRAARERLVASAALVGDLPDVAELGALTDTQLASRHLDPLEAVADEHGIDPADLAEMWAEVSAEPFETDALVDEPEASLAFVQLERAQLDWQRVESQRIASASRTYRLAMRAATATSDPVARDGIERSAIHQIAVTLRIADRTAVSIVHTADRLERSFSACWARFLLGQVPWRAMQVIFAQAEGLDPERIGEYDEAAATALDSTPLPRLKERLHRLRERLQSGTAAARHREALKSRSVLIEPAEDGMADLTIHGAAPELLGIDHQLTKAAIDVAGRPGETRTIGQLRYDILFDLLLEGGRRPPVDPTDPRLSVPDRKGVEPQVGVLIPAMTLLGVSDVPATLAGYGPIDLETAERLAGKAKTWTRILTDPVTGTIVDIDRKRYRPPADLRRLATTLDGACRCGCGKRDGDLDHVQEWALHRGRTALDNLILLARRCHVMKTSGPWHLRLYPDRTLAWTSIWGTRIVTRPETDLEPTPVPSPGPPPATASPPPDADSDCPF